MTVPYHVVHCSIVPLCRRESEGFHTEMTNLMRSAGARCGYNTVRFSISVQRLQYIHNVRARSPLSSGHTLFPLSRASQQNVAHHLDEPFSHHHNVVLATVSLLLCMSVLWAADYSSLALLANCT